MDLSKQYDGFAEKFSQVHDQKDSNRDNRAVFYNHIDFLKPGMKLLDVACGDGLDLVHYKDLGAEVFGVDASAELIAIAKQRLPESDIRVSLFEQLPFDDNSFDIVLSKYALQSSADMAPAFSEMERVLKSGGMMMYLVTHPFRQYFERKDPQANYFDQTIVDSHILNGTITVKEPSHTMNEYLNSFLFGSFDVQEFAEYWDAAAEQIDGKKYPGYFILKAIKR